MRFVGSAALVLSALAMAFPAPAQAPGVKAGIEAWQKGDYPAAVAIWRPLAEKGDADAAFNLGQAYRLGRGVVVNLAAAQTWLERAAKADHIDAQTTLGLLLFQNGNRAGGVRWLKVAAERGQMVEVILGKIEPIVDKREHDRFATTIVWCERDADLCAGAISLHCNTCGR